jgi:hypothetical protein
MPPMALVDAPGTGCPQPVSQPDIRPNADDAARLSGLLSLMVDPVQLRLIYALDIAADDFPAPLRDHCLRQLIALTHTGDSEPDS